MIGVQVSSIQKIICWVPGSQLCTDVGVGLDRVVL